MATDDTGAFGDLTGTGLTVGTNAFRLINGTDRAAYTATRGGYSFTEFRTMVYNAANWTQKDAAESVGYILCHYPLSASTRLPRQPGSLSVKNIRSPKKMLSS